MLSALTHCRLLTKNPIYISIKYVEKTSGMSGFSHKIIIFTALNKHCEGVTDSFENNKH